MGDSIFTYHTMGLSTETKVITQWEDLSADFVKSNKVWITDDQVFQLFPHYFNEKETIVIPHGEVNKSWDSLSYVLNRMVELELDKSDWIVGVGGGMVTDLTGFAASIYKRGIKFGFIPTTITAMVDASIGGKNGINHHLIKNAIGNFAQPHFIQINTTFFSGLSTQHWADGFAEIIKHALIGNEEMFDWLKKSTLENFQQHHEQAMSLIIENAKYKMSVVAQDPFDKGIRNQLNFGHTLGHAIEQTSSISHGQAVAIGMCFASWLSVQYQWLSEEACSSIKDTLMKYHLPCFLDFDTNQLMNQLKHDKKNGSDGIRFVLLHGIGKAEMKNIELNHLKAQIEKWKSIQ
jgi:3-dehydroquinate synthase